MGERTELKRIVAEAIIRTAERPPSRRGQWLYNEALLQSKASDARAYLAALEENP